MVTGVRTGVLTHGLQVLVSEFVLGITNGDVVLWPQDLALQMTTGALVPFGLFCLKELGGALPKSINKHGLDSLDTSKVSVLEMIYVVQLFKGFWMFLVPIVLIGATSNNGVLATIKEARCYLDILLDPNALCQNSMLPKETQSKADDRSQCSHRREGNLQSGLGFEAPTCALAVCFSASSWGSTRLVQSLLDVSALLLF